eukprot:TRINITY_DN5916_c0_g1_i4.p1 TRINITY_DN5916_c0_g1~~TRINITY_DN5916_c0_g1_i4.p1  ORF type:complete len:1190 (+),score=235.93 TRINITY_DN5916_c0_g1_i4:57-3626(+)
MDWHCVNPSLQEQLPSFDSPPLVPAPEPPHTANRSRSSSWQLVNGIGHLISARTTPPAEQTLSASPPEGAPHLGGGLDALGFALTPEERILYDAHQLETASSSEESLTLWNKLAAELEQSNSLQIGMADLKAGVAMPHRKWVWPRVCGAHARQLAEPELYGELCARTEAELSIEVKKAIDKDLPRTFRGHPLIQTPTGLGSLRRILLAYALHDPQVGYCQAMNLLAGMLLTVLGVSEETTCFWVLEAIVQRVFAGYYGPGLEASRMDHQVLCCLLKQDDPTLYNHLRSLPPALQVLLRWQLSLFVGVLPTESTLRVWDMALASKAGPKALLRGCTVLLLTNRARLLETESPEQCLAALNQISRRWFDGGSLVHGLCNDTRRLSWEQLQEYRQIVSVGGTDLNLILLTIPSVTEQGRTLQAEAGTGVTKGTIGLSRFGLTYSFTMGDDDQHGPTRSVVLPYYGIMSMIKQESSSEPAVFVLTMKDLRHLCFTVPTKHAAEMNRILKSHCHPSNVILHAQQHAAYLVAKCSATTAATDDPDPCPEDSARLLEAANQSCSQNNPWRISTANQNLELCPTYPHELLVPAAATDELLWEAAPFRSLGRIPVVSWLDVRPGKTGPGCAFVARCSQPLVGFWGQRSESDEELVRLMREASLPEDPEKGLVIIDCRDWLSACANASKGVIGRQAGGTEPTGAYGAREIKFMSMQNIHKVRASLDQYEREDIAGLTSVEAIWNWLSHTRDLLSASQQVVGLVDQGVSVLIHCSDGWDRTPQVVSLALILLDPYYRTYKGFRILVLREWVRFGHKFLDRTGREDEVGEERSPIFLQWLSALHEVVCQLPHFFEFSGLLLVRLYDAHVNGLLPCFLGADQACDTSDPHPNPDLFTSWKILDKHKGEWLNPGFTPTEGSLPHNFFQQSAELLLEHSFLARWCLKRRSSPWVLPVQSSGTVPSSNSAQHEVLCHDLKGALDRAEAQKLEAERRARSLHGELEDLIRERGHLQHENRIQAESLRLAQQEADETRVSLEAQKQKMNEMMSTPHLHLGILLQRALTESVHLLQPEDGTLQGSWLLCALNNTNMEQPRILVLTDKVLLRVKYSFDVSNSPHVVSHTRIVLLSGIVRLSGGLLQPYWSTPNKYAALRLQTAEDSPSFLQRWVTSVVWSGYPVQIYRSYVADKSHPTEEPVMGSSGLG